MLDKIPTDQDLVALIGEKRLQVWQELVQLIDSNYEMEHLWGSGGKRWDYEYKYRRGGKTLCALYAKQDCFGFVIILGKSEREKFEEQANQFSQEVQAIYQETKTYHDGKWLLFCLEDSSLFSDIEKLLLIKRKPNKK